MRLGSWDIDLGFVYSRFPEEWKDLDDALMRSRLLWNVLGVHLWNDRTDEGHLIEIRFHRENLNLRAVAKYTHSPAYWIVTSCGCSECKSMRRKLKSHEDE